LARLSHRSSDFIDLADHLGPAPGRNAPELVLDNPERKSHKAHLLDLPPMGVGIEALVSDHNLARVGYLRGGSGERQFPLLDIL
jgi:hypothetical protein